MTPDRTFSDAIGGTIKALDAYCARQKPLEPMVMLAMLTQLVAWREMARGLETAAAERDDLLAIARDVDRIHLDRDGVPNLRHMRAAVAPLAMAIPGTNVVTFPGARFGNAGGAA